ncbi:MAG TPA: 23S rRNA (adenine(2503)-C(2))-methyltransferase RlmN, partial [Polyangiaceae bacterium]|nr:23S rRNA (adenine(2503)-C(2))-methyltransferase RlmN [Polyangiaceae bacterium]
MSNHKAHHPIARLPEEWQDTLRELGEPAFRAQQIFHWIHKQAVLDVEQMTNLSRPLRAKLLELGVRSPLEEISVQRSSDGTRKLLLALTDGLAIECVMIPRRNFEDDDLDDEDDEGVGPDSSARDAV